MDSPEWFQNVFGFAEGNYEETRKLFRLQTGDDGCVELNTVPPKGVPKRTFDVGQFETPTLSELCARLDALKSDPVLGENHDNNGLRFHHIVDRALDIHLNPKNKGAVIQAASQFNCLEMPSPNVTPENGISEYYYDNTQGPACALACPAATVFRNYFWNGKGQGYGNQIDLLQDFGDLVGNRSVGGSKNLYWFMANGYALPTSTDSIHSLKNDVFDNPKFDRGLALQSIRSGIHWDTEVFPSSGTASRVCQVYCSALPIGYDSTSTPSDVWEPFAKLVLDAQYEATLAAAAVLSCKRGRQRVKVYLTKVGGGVFANSAAWISSSIQRALVKFQAEPLDVSLVHFGNIEQVYVDALPPIDGKSFWDRVTRPFF